MQATFHPWGTAAPVLFLAALTAWLLVRRRRDLAGTTLVAAWYWALVSLTALATCELILALVSESNVPRWAPHLRFCAAATTFCPTMAILGAKRPQDRAWQFIVASLWMVIALPALQSLVYAPGRSLDLDNAWRWFLLLLIVLGAANGLPTRFWLAWLLVAAAQVLLFLEQLPIAASGSGANVVLVAIGLLTLAAALTSFGLPRRASDGTDFDRQWRGFRDAFGTLWGLRVAERFNSAATMYGWGVRLGWRGLVRQTESSDRLLPCEPPREHEAALRQVWHSLVLRFVSPEWLAAQGANSLPRE